MTLVQYIILRKDLSLSKNKFIVLILKKLTFPEWSKGANIAQACHAVTKCLLHFYTDLLVEQYTSPENIRQMTKIILEVNLIF